MSPHVHQLPTGYSRVLVLSPHVYHVPTVYSRMLVVSRHIHQLPTGYSRVRTGVLDVTVLGPLQFILYTNEMFELVDNRLYAYADDSTLLVVVGKPADRPAVAASLYKELARNQEWCNHWCMILNPNKIKALFFSRSRTVNPPYGDVVLSVVSIPSSPNLDILGVKFDNKLTFEGHMRGIVSSISLREFTFYLGWCNVYLLRHLCVTSLLFCYCSPVWGSAAECHSQLLESQVYSLARLCPDQSFLSLCHRRRVAGLSRCTRLK